MCLLNYNKEYKHLTYSERTMIETWINNYPRAVFGYKSTNMILLEIKEVFI